MDVGFQWCLSRLTPNLALSLPTLLLTGPIIVPRRRTDPPPSPPPSSQPDNRRTMSPRILQQRRVVLTVLNLLLWLIISCLLPPPSPRDRRIGLFRLRICIYIYTYIALDFGWPLLFLMGCCGHSSTVCCSVMVFGGGVRGVDDDSIVFCDIPPFFCFLRVRLCPLCLCFFFAGLLCGGYFFCGKISQQNHNNKNKKLDEEKDNAVTSFFRKGFKNCTWWEEENELEMSTNWRS